MNFDEFYAEHQNVLTQVSYEFGAKGRRWGADHEDFAQEMSLFIFNNLSKLGAKATELEDPDRFTRWLAKTLRNKCTDHLAKMADQAGASDRGTYYWYSVPELKVLLDSMFDPEAKFNPPQVNGDERTKRDPAHGNNWLVTLADVESGYNKLTLEDQNLLALFHRDGYRNKDLADEWQLTEAQMSWRHTRAVERLLEHLGGPKPEPSREGDPFKGRRSMTNAAARALTSASYEED